MNGNPRGPVPFQAHIDLLRIFLGHRNEVVERVSGLLNAQRKPGDFLRDGSLLSRQFEDCFFTPASIGPNWVRLRGELREAHWASGFRPRAMPGMHNDLIDPAQMMIRGFHLWQQTRWPGRKGRVQYAHTLFNAYLVRCLELLSLRVWDAGPAEAAERISRLQGLLDQLWREAPADQPVLVRDARWLIPLAQSPTTDDLAPYFDVMERISGCLPEADQLEIHKAAVVMAGGHLRSQLRHHCITKHVSLDDHELLLTSRNSNALDFAVLIQGLVPLLAHYERALDAGDSHKRLALANMICQGISADPELFVNRVDLLGAYSMIEHLFSTTDLNGEVIYTAVGLRHVGLLREYHKHLGRLCKSLHEDCLLFKPVPGAYSPYGLLYGFSSNLTEHMVLKSLQSDAPAGFSLEVAFTDGNSDKLGWVNGWRKLPHVAREIQSLFEYPQQFADEIFERIERALRTGASGEGVGAVGECGRICVQSNTLTTDLPVRYIISSDPRRVAANQACFHDEEALLRDRFEGLFIVSYKTPGGWTAISKDLLTDVIGAGCDAKIVGLSGAAAATLRLMCPDLCVIE